MSFRDAVNEWQLARLNGVLALLRFIGLCLRLFIGWALMIVVALLMPLILLGAWGYSQWGVGLLWHRDVSHSKLITDRSPHFTGIYVRWVGIGVTIWLRKPEAKDAQRSGTQS